MKKSIFVNILLVGFTSLFAQIVLIRELLSQFQGNEISAGLTLGAWLFWTGIGSIFFPRILPKNLTTEYLFRITQILLACLIPLTFFLIQWLLLLFRIDIGSTISLPSMLIISWLSIGPICLLSGALFPLACAIFARDSDVPGNPIRTVYFLETLGAVAGGLFATFFFKLTSHLFLIFSGLIALHGIWTLIQSLSHTWNLRKSILKTAAFSLFIFTLIKITPILDQAYQHLRWKTGSLASLTETPYGQLAILTVGDQRQCYLDGGLLFTLPDPYSAEHLIHPALLAHPNPKTICLIGPENPKYLEEVLKHPSIEKVDYVIPDWAYHHINDFGEDSYRHSSKVTFIYQDGRQYLRTCSQKYDLILLLWTQPMTLRDNRFYTIEFFDLARSHLSRDGILALPVSASQNYIGAELSEYLSIIHESLASIFSEIAILPGETGQFLASNKNGFSIPVDSLINRLGERKLDVKYLNEFVLAFEYSDERSVAIKQSLHPIPGSELNRDLDPAAFTQLIEHWFTFNSSEFKSLFNGIKNHPFILIFLPLAISIMIFWNARSRTITPNLRPAILTSIGVLGFTQISLEVILILALQILIGQAYLFIALIVTGFMVGMLGASGFEWNHFRWGKYNLFIAGQALFTFFILILEQTFNILHQHSVASCILLIVLCVLTILAGFIGGFQFILGNSLYLQSGMGKRQSLGKLYGVDLIGSALGSILTTLFLIPIFGINTCLMLLMALSGWMVIMMTFKQQLDRKSG